MLQANFHIKSRDGLSRIGEFDTLHGKVSTPTLMPVIDPINPNIIPIPNIIELGANIIITNAYLLYKNENVRNFVLDKGLHDYLSYEGPIMTDSGAFQLMSYGSVEVTNKVITKFQEDINVDIGVFLDVPVAHGTNDELKEAVKKTIERAKEHILNRNQQKETQWVGPLQGGKNLDAFKQCSSFMKTQPFEIHAIGSVVPLMENYDYLSVVKLIEMTKKIIPINRPIHLFGAGHPMLFALACYLGIDLFDSAAYVLFAKKRRYLSTFGTYLLEDLDYFPCSCKFCSDTSPKDVRSWENNDITKFLANHNLAVSFQELGLIKQTIKDGRLFNLVLKRSMSHPRLAEAVQYLTKTEMSNNLEPFTSLSYPKARFFSHPWSLSDPMVIRYKERLLSRFQPFKEIAVLRPYSYSLPSDLSTHNFYIDPVFGLIPEEWKPIYPLLQNEAYFSTDYNFDENYIKKFILTFKEKFTHIYTFGVDKNSSYYKSIELDSIPSGSPISDNEKLRSILSYQFGINSFEKLPTFIFEFSRKTNRMKNFSTTNGIPWGVIRAHDNLIIPQTDLIKWLHSYMQYPNGRVIVENDVESFVSDGKSVFCKFVKDTDKKLRIGDEVIIVNSNDDLLGTGTLNYSPQEISFFTKGIAVKTRKRKDLQIKKFKK
ncbi:MAG: tRNA-guanine(15) transglycosylase [Candidatus Heimdallarchaeota archaeon LC_3]|nr:MAG: tRNA-guanine(15) transglycosylase [Candidatus Heimdallarchaeota archaeon LC_3]